MKTPLLLRKSVVLAWSVASLCSLAARAQEAAVPVVIAAAPAVPKLDSGDTAWLLISTALVMLMTPGLAFFYGGLVRKKNVLSVLMQCFITLCLISVTWVLFGYSLSFGPDLKGLIGNLSWAGLHGVGLEPFPDYAGTIPYTMQAGDSLNVMISNAMVASRPSKPRLAKPLITPIMMATITRP